MKKYFITGLITLLPFTVTIWLVQFFVNFLTKPFIGVMDLLVHRFGIRSPMIIHRLSQLLILILLFLLTWFLGFVARKFFFNKLFLLGDRLLFKIPMVNKIYKTSKEIVHSLFNQEEKVFNQTVLLPFPCPGSYCIGLISKKAPKGSSSESVSIFIPTTPNPATGYMVICETSKLIYLKMKPQDAIKYVVSCGMIQPPEPEK
jgi:uncharacterized membrane protein